MFRPQDTPALVVFFLCIQAHVPKLSHTHTRNTDREPGNEHLGRCFGVVSMIQIVIKQILHIAMATKSHLLYRQIGRQTDSLIFWLHCGGFSGLAIAIPNYIDICMSVHFPKHYSFHGE